MSNSSYSYNAKRRLTIHTTPQKKKTKKKAFLQNKCFSGRFGPNGLLLAQNNAHVRSNPAEPGSYFFRAFFPSPKV